MTGERKPQETGTSFSGRIAASPGQLMHQEVLAPQFAYEVRHLVPHYLLTEKALLAEYRRMGVLTAAAVRTLARALSAVSPDTLAADPQANMSDIAFAIEKHVTSLTGADPGTAAWHADRSRNDLQACAQLMFARAQLLETIQDLGAFWQAAATSAARTAEIVMPGYTHYQAAQVISPGFYLSAMADRTLQALHQLLGVYDTINESPLGAGAMAGQELAWDRERLAQLLGFRRAQRHALVSVASREWALRIAGELALLSNALSRFATDFIYWGSAEAGFIDLPDDMAGISSAMPQKKNFTVLERIRGKTGHVAAYYLDFLLCQRNTPYTNLVEVSKEGGSNLLPLFTTVRTALRLFTAVVERVRFDEARMRAACEGVYLGGFALANLLTLEAGIPYRTAQVIAGRYIVAASGAGLAPSEPDPARLGALCAAAGFPVIISPEKLAEALGAESNLTGKRSAGATAPEAVRTMLAQQSREFADLTAAWGQRRSALDAAGPALDALLLGEEASPHELR